MRLRFIIISIILLVPTYLLPQIQDMSYNMFGTKGLLDQKVDQQIYREPAILESSVNPNEYLVGPGDILAVNIWGEVEAGYNLEITPEGKLLIPTVKDIDLRELTLTKTKAIIADAVKKKYHNCEVTVTLVQLRRFRVTLAGQVMRPGAVIVTAADRASDAIRMTNPVEEKKESEIVTYSGRKTPIPVEVKKDPSNRHIVLTRRNGEQINVDLLAFEIIGKKDKNPHLLEGDVIYVPIRTKNLPMVGCYGAVHAPDVFEFIEGDRLMDIIKLAHGFTCNADLSNIEIARFNSDNKTTYTFKINLEGITSGNGEIENNIPLQIDDRIFVSYLPEHRIGRQVLIKGEVMYPREYPIEQNKTRLSEIVKMAGGFTKNASLEEAFVIRKAFENEIDPEYERLAQMTVEEMTYLEKEYFKIKSRERKALVALDFVKLFVENDTTKDIILHADDYIEIPAIEKTIKVSGQVVRAGLVEYEEGQNANYYIKKVGGYGWNADKNKIRIIRAETGAWEKPSNDTVIDIGDTIFVPEKKEISFWATFRDVLQISVQIATVILLIQSTTN